MIELRFEDHRKDSGGTEPPSLFRPTLLPGERVVSVETVKDAHGHASARVWIGLDVVEQ